MGQANRSGFKTKADASFRLGSLAAGAGASIGSRTTGVTRKTVQPSKPIPPPPVQFFASQPINKPKAPGFDTIRDQIKSFYGGLSDQKNKILQGFDGLDPVQRDQQTLDAASVAQQGVGLFKDMVGNVTNPVKDKEHQYKAPADRPELDTIRQVRKQVDMALRENTWSPQEKQQILDSYRGFVSKFTADDSDDLRSINNWSVQSAYKQLVQEARKDQDKDVAKGGDSFLDFFGLATQPKDDLGEFYDGPLSSAADDKYGPGFILSADADGWYKITSIKDLRHQLATAARDDPALAAKLINGMAAYGAYGGGTDKYAGQRIQYDKNNNPVAATFNTDDEAALGTFLSAIAVDQEQAENAQELVPWDQIMDQHAEQNRNIAASPAYGNQGGSGGNGRSYGYGSGGYGGGGGGGVSYTDAEQLKQLVNGIARSRLGYVLSDQQIAEFVNDYHTKEAAFVNARVAGQSGMQLDPESQAASWIETHMRDPMAAQQANSYISGLASFLMNGSFGSTS